MSLSGSGAWLQPLFIVLEKSTFTLNQEPSPLCSWACLAGARTSSGNEGGMMDLNHTSPQVFLPDLSVTTALSPVFLPIPRPTPTPREGS